MTAKRRSRGGFRWQRLRRTRTHPTLHRRDSSSRCGNVSEGAIVQTTSTSLSKDLIHVPVRAATSNRSRHRLHSTFRMSATLFEHWIGFGNHCGPESRFLGGALDDKRSADGSQHCSRGTGRWEIRVPTIHTRLRAMIRMDEGRKNSMDTSRTSAGAVRSGKSIHCPQLGASSISTSPFRWLGRGETVWRSWSMSLERREWRSVIGGSDEFRSSGSTSTSPCSQVKPHGRAMASLVRRCPGGMICPVGV